MFGDDFWKALSVIVALCSILAAIGTVAVLWWIF